MCRGLVALLALSFVAGCSSSYEPARSPRIETVVDGGQPTFVKDGERVGHLAFGTGLVDAVHANPRAEHHARVGRNLVAGGFVLSLAGLGTEIGGLVVLAREGASSQPSNSGLGVALLVTGVAAAISGSVMMLAGQTHIYDAVNIYNDGLGTSPPPTPAPTAPLGPRVQ
jgi:hypothetical protein